MKTRQHSLMRQLQLFDDSYEVYMVLPCDQDAAGDSRIEVLRITGQEDVTTTVAVN
ncbi:MAG: hypothetical protein HYY25_03330 [Candidatus Wallbacteria bacterium]|nr:hypothetical protein [Candidatus Wallbacteria bacterium]MBI4866846.1 hypothetical protein [Candidatus Wallbacteria bacterium]